MNNYNLYQTGNKHYCDCCLKDIDTDNDDYIIGQEKNKGFIFCSEKCNAEEKIMEIKIYKNPISSEIIKTCSTIQELYDYNDNVKNLFADQISINNQIMLGWDEIEQFEKHNQKL